MSVVDIGKAWVSVFKGEITEKAKEKAMICKGCDSAVYFVFADIINDEIKEIKGLVCKECKCPLSAKIRSTDKCPLGKW